MKILKSLDPHYLIHRMATDKIVGVLADRDLGDLADADMLLADGEVDPDCEPMAHGVVRLRKGVRFASGEAAVAKLGEKLDPFMAQTFEASSDPVWFHPLSSVDAWKESSVVKGLEVPVRVQKGAETEPDEMAVQELSAADLGDVAKLLDEQPDIEGAWELAVVVKAEYDRRGLEPDEELQIFKGLWAYPAGKAALSKRLVEMMPVHKVYVEPFIGSGAVLFAKEKAPTEVVNDYDEEVAEAWQLLSVLSEPDLKRLQSMNWTGDRDTFMRMKKESGGDDVVRLHRFFYLSRFAYGAMRGKSFSPGMQGRILTMPRKLEINAPRAKGVKAFHGDYETVCRKYDGPDTLHFMDPPYAGYNTNVGESEFDEERFFKLLKELKGKWIVTYGVRGKLPKMLRDSEFTVVKVNTRRSINTMRGVGGDGVLKQIIAYNYDLDTKDDPPPAPQPEEPEGAPVEDEKKKIDPGSADSISKTDVGAITAEALRGVDDPELLFIHSWMHRFYNAVFRANDHKAAGNVTRDQLVEAERVVQAEMQRRGIKTGAPHSQHGLTREAAVHKDYDLREPLAAYAHDAWSRWMRNIFENGDSISAEDAERWKRQMETTYADLSEEEKESDRMEADRMLAVMSGRGTEVEKAAAPEINPAESLAVFKPSDENSFSDVKELLEKFDTDEALGGGVGVGPKWNGKLAVVHSADGGVSIHIDGNPDEQVKSLPVIAATAAKFADGFALVGDVVEADIGAVFMARDVLSWAGEDHASDPWEDRQKILNQALPRGDGGIAPSPVRLVHSADNLKAAITWATDVPGAVGAVLTPSDSVATPGGSPPAISDVRTPRIVNVLVIGVESSEPGSTVYRCAVGPLSDSDSNRMKDVIEIDGENYTPIGSTFPTSVEASEGDVLRVEVGEISVIDSNDSGAIGWDTSKVLEQVHVKPATVSEVRELARPHEIQKLCKILKRDSERHYILSVVLEPNDGEGDAPLDPDAHDEIYSEDEIWDACVYWYEQGAGIGVMHEREATTAEMLPVHNFVAPVDMVIGGEKVLAGAWLIGSLVLSAALWQRIESGELNAWSVDGRALRRPEAIAA